MLSGRNGKNTEQILPVGIRNPTTMPATLELHGRDPITYKSAANKESNIIHQLSYLPATAKLLQEIWEQRKEIEALTKHHLGLGNEHTCTVLEQATWIQGSFNICVPIEAKSDHFYRKVIFRRPIPHRLAEGIYPGTIDEKLSCEVGAYTWMQDKCPNIRIPHLYGFGFSDSRHVNPVPTCPFADTNYLFAMCSLPTCDTSLSMCALCAWSGAIFMNFFSIRPSHSISPTRPVAISAHHTWF